MSKLPSTSNPTLCANGAKKHCRNRCYECRAIEADRIRRSEERKAKAWDDLGNTLRDMGNDLYQQ